jgi:AraC family transcriptional activator of tynA and feaB
MGNVVHALQTKHYHVVHGVELPRDPTHSEDTGFAVQGCSRDFLTLPELDYERWRHVVRTFCGRYSPGDIEPETFAGRVRARRICGFVAMDLGCNAHRVERTGRDVRFDCMDHYYAIFQIAGRSTILQNDQAMELARGDVALVDAARPVTYRSYEESPQWLSLQLPRLSLVSHLGLEPQCSLCQPGGAVGARLLRQLVLDGVEDEQSMSAPASAYMRLAFYDLLGTLFAPPDSAPVSRHANKLFTRICAIIHDRFADPGFSPCDVAGEAGISLRYLQKLFTMRNSTCGHFIHSLRLDHAARLLQRRALLNTSQPISEIAYASGFGDYPISLEGFAAGSVTLQVPIPEIVISLVISFRGWPSARP